MKCRAWRTRRLDGRFAGPDKLVHLIGLGEVVARLGRGFAERLDGAAHTGEGITDRNQSVFAHEATRYSQKYVWLQLSQNTWPKASVTSSPFSGAAGIGRNG